MITGLTHAAIRVFNITASLDYYCNGLGLSEKFRLTGEDGNPWLVYIQIAERQFIELFPGAAEPYQDKRQAGPVHICLEVDDILETYKEVTSRGIQTRGEPILGADGAWQFWSADPDGNPIEFHQFTSDSMQLK